MRLVYFGSGRFAVPALARMASSVVLAVTQPDRPSGRGMRLRANPVKEAALELGIPVESPDRCRDPEFVSKVRDLRADALLVAAYGQILPVSLLEAAARGGINLHGSILPAYRGAAPIQRCILDGCDETGVTLMQMDRGMDTGDMIAVERVRIGPDETYGELEDRLAEVAANMAGEWLPRIVAGDYPRTPQTEEGASIAPKVRKEDAELDPGRSAKGEYDRFRAFTPSPGAYVRSKWGWLKIGAARFKALSAGAMEAGIPPGTILEAKASLTIAFSGGAIEFVELQPEGKKRMSGRDFANGMRLTSGMRLTDG